MTKKPIISHASWAVIAAATFLLGWTLKPVSSDSDVSISDRSVMAGEADDPLRISGKDSANQKATETSKEDTAVPASTSLGTGDFKALAERSVRGADPIERRLAFSEILKALTPENALEIREQLVAFGLSGDAWNDFNYSWGMMAGQEAVLFAEQSEESDLSSTLTGWAAANPTAAMAFLDNLPEGMRDDRARLSYSVVNGIADSDPKAAADLVLRLAEEGQKGTDKLISMVAGKALRSVGFDQAKVWSESLPDGSIRNAAMSRIAYSNVGKDPEGTAKWVESFAEEGFAFRVISSVGTNWARRDPQAATSWLENLPESRGQAAGMRAVFGDWEDRDPLAATQYLAKMPKSPLRDSAISGFSKGYARQDPEAAIAWASDIGNAKLREETLTYAAQTFLRVDPVPALDWLEASGLPADTQRKILQASRRR